MQDPGGANVPGRAASRLVIVLIALFVTATVDPPMVQPAEAAGLGRSIAATRHRMVRTESRMRGADKRIAELRRFRHTGDRAIRKASRRLEHARHRYVRARGRVDSTADRLRLARLELDRAVHVRPNPGGRQVGLVAGPRHDVRDLQRELRRVERHASRLDERRDDARREKRSRLRTLGRSRHGIGDVAARRERAESVLGYLIARMIGLARQKAGVRSMASPARTGFRRPARGPVTQGFGCTGFRLEPPRGKCAHFHDGIDIAGRRGSRVRAAAQGVVAYAGWNPWDADERAYIVMIVHRGGYQSIYGHLLPVRKAQAGKAVRRGQVIGLLGSTGNSTGPHVHWGVRRGNTPVDPRSIG